MGASCASYLNRLTHQDGTIDIFYFLKSEIFWLAITPTFVLALILLESRSVSCLLSQTSIDAGTGITKGSLMEISCRALHIPLILSVSDIIKA